MPRPIWSGSIVFGLVNVPVNVHTAVREHTVRLHMLSPGGDCRLHRKLYCPDTGKEYDFKDTTRGFEVAPNQYVLVSDEELQQVKPDKGRTIDILDFVDLNQVDPIYFDRTYYLAPDEKAGKGYSLLVEALEKKNKVGIAKVVMRSKEYLVALRSMGGVLVMETMHFADEIAPVKEVIDKPRAARLDKREVTMAGQLIDNMVRDFDPARYKDEYRDRLMEMIERKAEGEEVVIEEAPEPEDGRTLNFMKALEASLKQAKRKGETAAGTTRRKAGTPARRRRKTA